MEEGEDAHQAGHQLCSLQERRQRNRFWQEDLGSVEFEGPETEADLVRRHVESGSGTAEANLVGGQSWVLLMCSEK